MTMDCADCLDRIYPYLDRELSPAELAQVRDHLAVCGDCETRFVLERVFLDQLKGRATADVAPAAVRERLIVRIRQHPGGRI